jgi:hypothetical protein
MMQAGITTRLWIGIDWGTHSSKWVCHRDNSENPAAGEIHNSTLVRINEQLLFPRGQDIPEGDERIESLKGIIIKDPFGPFWDADRMDSHSSLGEAVSFSFCCLLTDVSRFLKEGHGIDTEAVAAKEIGFSLPNWLRGNDKKSKTALLHFHQAVNISCWAFDSIKHIDLPCPGMPFPIERWKRIVSDGRRACRCETEDISVDTLTQDSYGVDKLRWSYLVESCAAGLPYLRSIITTIEKEAPAGLAGLGKLLVVDVGAGSTDIGYMLRTISREGRENLFYFPPAATFEIAGNDLTERLRSYYEQRGEPITLSEAEARKLGEVDWYKFEFASDWRLRIRRRTKEYVSVITDARWLPAEVPLQIVVTGGSGLVKGLKDEIKAGVMEGLEARGIHHQTIDKTRLIDERLSGWRFEAEAEYARRAVSIGAADLDKPALKYCARLDKPFRVEPRKLTY